MEMCISAGEDDVRMKSMKAVHSMLKNEVEKAQLLLSSSHDKAIKVIKLYTVFAGCRENQFYSFHVASKVLLV